MTQNGLFDWAISSLNTSGEQEVMDEYESKVARCDFLLLLEQLGGVDHLAQDRLVCRDAKV